MATEPLAMVENSDPERSEPSKTENTPPSWANIIIFIGIHSDSDRAAETALLLSLAEYSGWSAELISNNLRKKCGHYLMPEVVWEIHHSWAAKRDGDSYPMSLKKQISDAMIVILKDFGVEVPFRARPLNKTPRPVSICHADEWNMKARTQALLEGYTSSCRQSIIKYLSRHENQSMVGRITARERHRIEQFGPDVAKLFVDILRYWYDQVLPMLAACPWKRKFCAVYGLAEVGDKFGKIFAREWEAIFGAMDDIDHSIEHVALDSGVYPIRSTGAAAKIFLIMMLIDRLVALETRREILRKETLCIDVRMKDVPEDSKNCPICLQPMGLINEDGECELPMQLAACCGNYIGRNCLMTWYRDASVNSCPICRWRVTPKFLEHLGFSRRISYEDDWEDVNDLDEERLASVALSPTFVNRELIRLADELEEGEIMDSENPEEDWDNTEEGGE